MSDECKFSELNCFSTFPHFGGQVNRALKCWKVKTHRPVDSERKKNICEFLSIALFLAANQPARQPSQTIDTNQLPPPLPAKQLCSKKIEKYCAYFFLLPSLPQSPSSSTISFVCSVSLPISLYFCGMSSR